MSKRRFTKMVEKLMPTLYGEGSNVLYNVS